MSTEEEVLEVSDLSEWKKGSRGEPVRLPSGRVMKIKRPGMDSFIRSGTIPNSLLGVVTEALEKGKKQEEIEVELSQVDLTSDPQKLQDIMQVADDVCIQVVVSPKVHAIIERQRIEEAPMSDDDREEKLDSMLFVDEVPSEDKFFIFQYVVGGTTDLERFREQLASDVGVARDVDGTPRSPKRSGGAKRK